jgi:hypothetical protein
MHQLVKLRLVDHTKVVVATAVPEEVLVVIAMIVAHVVKLVQNVSVQNTNKRLSVSVA